MNARTHGICFLSAETHVHISERTLSAHGSPRQQLSRESCLLLLGGQIVHHSSHLGTT